MAGATLDPLIISCECCRLKQRVKDRDGAIPTRCDQCNQHQGNLPDRRLQRAEDHEAMIRRQLDACRASEARAQIKARRGEERTRAALTSRGNLAASLHEAAQRTSHDCPVAQVARRPHVTKWAEQNERIQRGDWHDDED